jgi:hypothetical protein
VLKSGLLEGEASSVEDQKLNVDTVAGATLSSAAFLLAVEDALTALGEDVSAREKRNHAAPADPADLADSYDVVVVGSGGAGFTAAISAANKGASVLLLEKLGVFGGSTALSGGEMAVPGNWIQVNMGAEDSPEQLAADMLVLKSTPDLPIGTAVVILDRIHPTPPADPSPCGTAWGSCNPGRSLS